MLCAVEFERNRLVDRHGYGLGGGVAVVPYMDGDGFSFHESVEPCGGVTAQASLRFSWRRPLPLLEPTLCFANLRPSSPWRSAEPRSPRRTQTASPDQTYLPPP